MPSTKHGQTAGGPSRSWHAYEWLIIALAPRGPALASVRAPPSGAAAHAPAATATHPCPGTLQPDYLKPLDSNFVGQYENLKTLETLSRPFVVLASTDEQRIYRCACGGGATARRCCLQH